MMRNHRKTLWLSSAALIGALAGCSEDATAPEEPAAAEQGGEATGDVAGGTINDAMIPLEALRSQSPTVRRSTTVTTSYDGEGGNQTTIEATTSVTSSDTVEAPAPPQPAPPVPPAAPAERG